MSERRRIGLLGAGSWGTALGVLLARSDHRVRVWDGDAEVLRSIRETGRNTRYLPDFEIPEGLAAEFDPAAALRDAELVVVAVPSAAVARCVADAAAHIPPNVTVVSASKGLCPETGMRNSQLIAAHSRVTSDRIVALSGPNLALEICRGIPTTTVVAGRDRERMEEVLCTFSGPRFRVYTNPDIIGVELGGAVKNVMAIGAGINDGLGYGDNTKASLLTRGLAEMTRVGVALGAEVETFRGLAGLGDLIATSVSPKSRNYRVGCALGQGRGLAEVLEELGQVAEGVDTARAVRRLAREHGVEVPVTDAICSVLFEGVSAQEAVEALMARAPRDELLDQRDAPQV